MNLAKVLLNYLSTLLLLFCIHVWNGYCMLYILLYSLFLVMMTTCTCEFLRGAQQSTLTYFIYNQCELFSRIESINNQNIDWNSVIESFSLSNTNTIRPLSEQIYPNLTLLYDQWGKIFNSAHNKNTKPPHVLCNV